MRTEIILNSTQGEPRWSFAAEAGQGHSGVVSTAQRFLLNQRTHLAAVRRGDRYSLFVDGKLAVTRDMDDPLLSIDQPWRIGKAFIGEIDTVRISKVARYESDFAPAPRFVPDTNTVALYQFDDGQGDVLNDSSGNEHHGKIVGAKWVKPGNWALNFSGDDRVDVPTPALAGLPEFCLEAWATPRDLAPKDYASLYGSDWQGDLRLTPTGRWGFIASALGEWHFVAAPEQAIANQRAHVAGVLRADGIHLYVDGKHVAHKVLTNPRGNTPKMVAAIGRNFIGDIEQVRVSKSAQYEKDFVPQPRLTLAANTLALYRFDEGHGDVLSDSSGNNHHGKIFGAKWVKLEPPPPPVDYALEFDRQSHVDIPSLERHSAEPLTIEAWVKDVPDHTAVLTSIHGKAPVQMHFHIGQPSGGERLTEESPLWRLIDVKDEIDFATWKHLAYVIDAKSARFFIDGVKVREKVDRFAPVLPAAYQRGAAIGADLHFKGQRGWTLQGKIRELRISKSARYDGQFTPEPRFEPDAATLALYHFDEGAGDVLRDSSGNDHHGKIVGAKWVQVADAPVAQSPAEAGRRDGHALSFGEGEAHVLLPRVGATPDKPYTVELWVRPRELSSQRIQAVIVGEGGRFELSSNGKWKFFTKGLTRTNDHLYADKSASAAWTHLAGVFDGQTCKLFVDGRQQRETGEVRQSGASVGGYLLGISGTPGVSVFSPQAFNGDIAALRISGRARYASDFTPTARFEDDQHTLALYHFDEGEGDVLVDSSGNNHHGKIVGANWVLASGGRESPESAIIPAKPVDLLALIDPQKHALDAGVRKEAGVVLTPKHNQTNTRVVIPFADVPDQYDLRLVAERQGNDQYGLNLGFVMGGRQATLDMDGSSPRKWCISRIDGKSMQNGNVTTVVGERLKLGQRATVVLQVRRDGVKALCDGAAVIDWKGRPEQLSLWDRITLPDAKTLFFFSQAEFAIHELTLTPVISSE